MTGGRLRRPTLLVVTTLLVLLAAACQDAERLARLVPRVIAPGHSGRLLIPIPSQPIAPRPELPPAQRSDGFEVEPLGLTERGQLAYRVRIKSGGSPYLVAATMLTPLFQADGKDAAVFVGDAYFQANPGRTAATIQPGDQFTLFLPPNTFVVRWQTERRESLGLPARLREYVSERGDRLRYYLSDPFPVLYELQPAQQPGHSIIRFDPDLRFMVHSGQVDLARLAQLVFRVPDPDFVQLATLERLVADERSEARRFFELDRTRAYLDPVREVFSRADRVEPVREPGLEHLVRALPVPDLPVPYLAVEDALGPGTSPAQVGDGQVFRILYGRDGTVQVFYKTGLDDTFGKRDPYQLRENERWATLYRTLAPETDTPVKWGPGEPSDLEPFPSARDPRERSGDPKRAYDYLLPGRALVLTFRPVRSWSDTQAEAEFRDVLGELSWRYRPQIKQLLRTVEALLAPELAAEPEGPAAIP